MTDIRPGALQHGRSRAIWLLACCFCDFTVDRRHKPAFWQAMRSHLALVHERPFIRNSTYITVSRVA